MNTLQSSSMYSLRARELHSRDVEETLDKIHSGLLCLEDIQYRLTRIKLKASDALKHIRELDEQLPNTPGRTNIARLRRMRTQKMDEHDALLQEQINFYMAERQQRLRIEELKATLE